ncbi:hypothetical protein PUN28_009642 [Cardiocondyla obscurior]|uniref:Uncharacterized protein n=1 Tax=Cardiocondyla obscurior TaxID=286306 RepID=A0AAW2FTA1_9HYME
MRCHWDRNVIQRERSFTRYSRLEKVSVFFKIVRFNKGIRYVLKNSLVLCIILTTLKTTTGDMDDLI